MSLRSTLASMAGSMGAYLGFGDSRRDAARNDIPEMTGWNPPPGFAGNDLWGEREAIIGRGRDLDKNNAWINGGLDRRVESVIGEDIQLSAQPMYSLLNRDFQWRVDWTSTVQARFRAWANDIEHRNDARQVLSFGQQARLAYLSYVRDGECAAEIRASRRGLANTTNVLLFEAERISMPQDRALVESPTLRNGIAFDANGAPIGYWIRKRRA